MQPEEVEQLLFEHAIRTKIRPPLAERVSNLAYNRLVASGVVAGAALVCSLAMIRTGTTANGNSVYDGVSHPQVTDTDPNKRPHYQMPASPYPQNAEPVAASLAMSPIGG